MLPKDSNLTGRAGSIMHMAPEIINNEAYDSKVDVWSTCIVLFSILFGDVPFKGTNKLEISYKIANREINYSSRKWKNVSP